MLLNSSQAAVQKSQRIARFSCLDKGNSCYTNNRTANNPWFVVRANEACGVLYILGLFEELNFMKDPVSELNSTLSDQLRRVQPAINQSPQPE